MSLAPVPPRSLAGFLAGSVMLVGAVAVPTAAAAQPNVRIGRPAMASVTPYINPFIGTDDSNSPDPVGGGAGGSTYPGAVVPFGMVQFSPDTPTASPSGYRDRDRTIEEFSLTHFDGAGCPNNEDLGILPVTGDLGGSPGANWTSYASGYTKANEAASPGYYRNRLDRYATTVELTATTRTGMAKLTYPNTTSARVLVNTSRSATGNRRGDLTINGSQLTGSVTAGGFCGSSKTYKIYFAIRFDRAPTGSGTWQGGAVSPGSASVSGVDTGGYVTFDTSTNPTVTMTVALSYVSAANATANLAAENPGFDFTGVRAGADAAWNAALSRVQVSGGDPADLQKFYTALYHVMQSPNVASDINGQYMGFDNAVHTAGHPVYQNYSGWDIYRSWAALMAFVAPDVMTDVVRSMVLDGQQGGLLPKWSQATNEDFIMTGDPGPIIVASAYAFGVRGFDTAAALALMRKSAAGGTTQGKAIRGRESGYESKHFIAEDPSDSLEYSASDFAIAQFAHALGDTGTYQAAMARAQWWRNVFNPESGYIHPRHADGTWPWPLDPASPSGYTEGNASQYTWMVPYNLGGLIDAMGGAPTAIQRLDHHFTQLNGGLSRPYFYIGNEPEHGVPWVYNFAGDPAGTSAAVRRVMTESFTTGAGGLPGNDDLGATSAWYVWAALGMYPATPGADTLALHGPQFPEIVIRRPGGDVRITGGSATAPYVRGLSVNGVPTSHNYLRYGDVANGVTLAYTMGGTPGDWGTGDGDVPPSFTDGAVQPPAAPRLGPDLALNRPVTGSATCAATETLGRAVDGSLAGNSKWCSHASPGVLQVDLGSARNVSSFVVKHAGLGGETTGWNTGAFTIETSLDGTTWQPAVSVTGSRASRTFHPVAARSARYVRLTVTTPTNNGDDATRIYEFEVY
ncbi:alpha-mannosidase [Planosporangium thailandense]|uniref:Alpha-mannosidase n=1 Tax=Planosporangium thailandense TaxID=765197 RepID=A0ABX0Y0R1_9ACTN|nr:GH92 family glycosyl hydrolase [Planosporangium thailandense]NJC71737.1 alpha-mannosidase [Planosporangium thailandense]